MRNYACGKWEHGTLPDGENGICVLAEYEIFGYPVVVIWGEITSKERVDRGNVGWYIGGHHWVKKSLTDNPIRWAKIHRNQGDEK